MCVCARVERKWKEKSNGRASEWKKGGGGRERDKDRTGKEKWREAGVRNKVSSNGRARAEARER